MNALQSRPTPATRRLLLAASLAFCATLPAGAVTIFTDFSGGGNTVNGFAGIAGDGWTAKWSANKNGSGAWSGSVVSQKLRVSNNMNAVGTQHIALTRPYDVTLLDLQEDYTISFDISFSTLTNFGSGDYVGILEGGSNTSGIPTNSQFWGVYFDGSDGLLKWYDASLQQAVSTGIAVELATTYAFNITLDPVQRTWVGAVTATDGEGSVSVTSSAISIGTDSVLDAPDRLFRLYSRADSPDTENQSAITYDFDNLTIHQAAAIPEPSSAALLFGAGAGLLVAATRRGGRSRQ